MSTSTLPSYEPRVIEQFAENLYKKASAFVVGSVVIGAALGAAFGAVPLTSLGAAWPLPSFLGFATLLTGGIFGAAIGYVIGDTRSFGYRLQAQGALCQLQTERNTAVIAAAVAAARPAARPQPQPEPQPQRAAQVQPPATPVQRPAAPAPTTPATPVAPAAPSVAASPAQPAAPATPPVAPPRESALPPVTAPEAAPAAAPSQPPVTPPVSAARVA